MQFGSIYVNIKDTLVFDKIRIGELLSGSADKIPLNPHLDVSIAPAALLNHDAFHDTVLHVLKQKPFYIKGVNNRRLFTNLDQKFFYILLVALIARQPRVRHDRIFITPVQYGGKIPSVKKRDCLLPVGLRQICKMKQILDRSQRTLQPRPLHTDMIWYHILTAVADQYKLPTDTAARLDRCPVKAVRNLCLLTRKSILIYSHSGI